MTRLLVSVTSAAEAVAVLDAGADVIDAKDPTRGALGALPLSTVRAILEAVGDRAEVSVALGDDVALDYAINVASLAPAYLKVAVPSGEAGAALVTFLGRELAQKARLVAVFAADGLPDLGLVPVAAMAGFVGVMLDTSSKTAGLLSVMELADIAHFVAAARRAKVMVGLAGSLKVVDVGTLLPLNPDLLGFRGGICVDDDRRKPVDPARVRAVQAALAVHTARRHQDL